MKRILSLVLAVILLAGVSLTSLVHAETTITLDDVNRFLNESAKLGEGSKANPVAIIPINHIDGPQDEDLFYGFVSFKYEARNYIKYQVTFISCTCRSADVNYWTTAYVDLTLPESGMLVDTQIKTLSFGPDGTGRYTGGFWGDSDPIPSGQTFEMIDDEFVPYFVGKTYGDIKGLSTIADIQLADYQAGEGRGAYEIDTWTGATVSTNNILRMLQALIEFHGTDVFFEGDESLKVEAPAAEAKTDETKEAAGETAGVTQAIRTLPDPIDTNRTYKPSKDAAEEVPCTEGSFGPTCSAINNENLLEYMGRPDVMYIDTRDFEDYMKKHFRNFEAIPFFALIFNAEANTDATKIQLYGGSPTEPVPVYEESDELLEVLFPKDKTLFIMCQSGGRVGMLMNIMKARGWDMSKVYNVGGMAQYSGNEYKPFITDTAEFSMTATYNIEGLTRINP